MYQSHQISYTQPPVPTHQYLQGQSWHPQAAPQPPPRPTESQHFEPSAPPLPPKPELRSTSTNSPGSTWGGEEVANSPVVQTPLHYWPPHPPARVDSPGMGHRAYTSPMMSSAPRIGGTIPPEQVRLLDSARFTESEQAASRSHPQQMTIGQSPEMGPYALVPPTPQMRGMTPMPQSPYLSAAPRAPEGSSPPQASMSPLFKSSYPGSPSPMPPPPPPPLANWPYAATPAPPNYNPLPPQLPHLPPPPPPLPAHHSESQVHTSHSHTPAPNSQARHLSLPPLPPSTPAPNHPPPASTSTPAPPAMPAPSFPQPFAAPHAPMHAGSHSWIGGIAPRPSTHFWPHYQPDWNNMPSIPQEFPATPAPPPPPRPPATPAPPAHAVSFPAVQMPTAVVPPPPPVPPHPKHAATSPTVLTQGQWSGGLQRSGTVSSPAPPLPPKEPVLPPNEHVSHSDEHSWSLPQEPPLPPKEPIPPSFPTASAPGGSSPRLTPPPPRATTLEEQHEAELREAMRMSLAISPRGEGQEDPELARALRESMREVSIPSAGSGSNFETGTGLNLGSGAWVPVLPRADSPEAESVYQSRPPPPLPNQVQATVPATPPQEIISETPVTASSPAETQAPDEDGPPPPAYEEVTGSLTATPAVVSPVPLPPTMPEPIPSAPILGSVSPRERNTQNNLSEELNISLSAPEPPVAIEVIPPSASNNLARREHRTGRSGRLERSSSEGNRPARVSDEISTSPPLRRSTQSPPRGTDHARASSQSRPHPVVELPRQPELTAPSFARPRVASTTSQASLSPASRLGRASMFFGMSGSSLSLGSNDPPPRRTWAIDEEPSKGNGLSLQAPEPPISLLRSRNASEVNLHEGVADAPPNETLLNGVIYGFRDPDPPTPVPMPAADPPPPNISLDDSGAFHIQALNFRHLLRLLSHYGSTSLMATPAAIAASKSGIHSARVVLHFVRGPHERDPWFCRLFLELHTPPERETAGPPDTTLPYPGTKIIAPVGPRGKLYVVPGPLPQLPLSFQGLSIFLINRLEEARRAPSDSTQRRLERILIECYGSVTGAGVTNEEIGGRQKGSGSLLSLGGIFSKVKDKLSSDKPNGNVNDHTYDLISPFHLEDYH